MNPFDTAWALMKAPMDYHGYSDIPHQVGDKVHDQLTGQPGKIAQDLGEQPMLGAPVSPDLMYDAYQLEDESHHGGQRFGHELTNQEEMDFQDYLMEHVPSGQGGPSDVEYRQLVDEFNRQRGNETPAFNRRFHQSPFQKAFSFLKELRPAPGVVPSEAGKPEMDYDAYQVAEQEGNSEEQQAIQHQHIRNMMEYYKANPPQWTRDDWPEIGKLSDEQGGWPPPGTPGVDYPHVADHEWDEWDDWEQHRFFTERWRKLQEEEEAQRQAEEQAAAERAAAQEAARQQSKSGWKHGWVKGQRR